MGRSTKMEVQATILQILLFASILLISTCKSVVATPEICSSTNKGHCECGDVSQGFQTYVFTNLESEVRCFTVYTPTTFEVDQTWPLPVMFSPNCYAKDRLGGIDMSSNKSLGNHLAARYGYIRIGISTPRGGWEFANDGLINDDFPMPCENSIDMFYLTEIIAWLDLYPDLYDTQRLYAEGHSQNSMFSAYLAYCFHQRVQGVWQSGSGMSLNGMKPYLPGCEGQVLHSDWTQCQAQHLNCQRCSDEYSCPECQYFPIYPCYTPEKPMVECISEYTNDGVTTNLQNPDVQRNVKMDFCNVLNPRKSLMLMTVQEHLNSVSEKPISSIMVVQHQKPLHARQHLKCYARAKNQPLQNSLILVKDQILQFLNLIVVVVLHK